MWEYYKPILRLALSKTKDFYGWNRQTLSVPMLFVFGLLAGYFLLGKEAVMEQIMTTFAFGLAPIGLFTIGLFLVNLARAPYLIDQARQREIAALEQRPRIEADEKEARRREYIIERLKELIRQDSELPHGWVSADDPGFYSIGAHDQRVKRFLAQYFDELYVKRYEEQDIAALEQILKEFLD